MAVSVSVRGTVDARRAPQPRGMPRPCLGHRVLANPGQDAVAEALHLPRFRSPWRSADLHVREKLKRKRSELQNQGHGGTGAKGKAVSIVMLGPFKPKM